MWQPRLQSTDYLPDFDPQTPNPNIMNCASGSSKCTDMPIDKTGNPFCTLQKQSSVKREKDTQETTRQTLNSMNCPYCTGVTGIQEDRLAGSSNACQDQVLWPEGILSASERELFQHKASTFSDLSEQCFWNFLGRQNQLRIWLEPITLFWKNILYPNICTQVPESEQGWPEGQWLG